MRKLTRLAPGRARPHDHRMGFALLALAVFVSAVAIDYADARYVLAVEARRATQAAGWSVAMHAVGALGLVAVLNVSLWLMIPEGLGVYVGTYVALRGRACAS